MWSYGFAFDLTINPAALFPAAVPPRSALLPLWFTSAVHASSSLFQGRFIPIWQPCGQTPAPYYEKQKESQNSSWKNKWIILKENNPTNRGTVKRFTEQPCNQPRHHPNNLTEDRLNLLTLVISSRRTDIQPEQWHARVRAPRGSGCILSRSSFYFFFLLFNKYEGSPGALQLPKLQRVQTKQKQQVWR